MFIRLIFGLVVVVGVISLLAATKSVWVLAIPIFVAIGLLVFILAKWRHQ